MLKDHTSPTAMKHDTPEFEDIAQRGLILQTQVGSGVYGTAIEGQDDRDEMGICVEPPEYVIGLKKFEQYEYRTKPMHVRSGAGDLDLTIYSLRKWMRLALAGNPTVLIPLFAQGDDIVFRNSFGKQIQANASIIISQQAGLRFIGYLQSQRERMLGSKSQRTNRPELVEKYGFDTKFAMHAVRLGLQGVELMSTGRITLPIPEPDLTWLRDLRQGKHTKDETLDACRNLENQILVAMDHSSLPEKPDYDQANKWLVDMYIEMWRMDMYPEMWRDFP